ncbi:MAG: CSLREA domain-containing protein, partial [Alphaproteobacteria bacterium]
MTVLTACIIQSVAAKAADFTVNSTLDAVDANPGDGICQTASGDCTLRAAIGEANQLAGLDWIILPAGTYTITMAGAEEDANATGDLDVTDHLVLTGASSVATLIDGGNLDRVLHVDPGANGISVAVS